MLTGYVFMKARDIHRKNNNDNNNPILTAIIKKICMNIVDSYYIIEKRDMSY
jgi:hypothetical protein